MQEQLRTGKIRHECARVGTSGQEWAKVDKRGREHAREGKNRKEQERIGNIYPPTAVGGHTELLVTDPIQVYIEMDQHVFENHSGGGHFLQNKQVYFSKVPWFIFQKVPRFIIQKVPPGGTFEK